MEQSLIIVAAVDGSDHSGPVVREAVKFAKLMDAELHLLHVAHLTGLYYSALAAALTDEDELEKKLVEAVWDRIDPMLTELDGLDVTKVGRRGYAGDEIADYAEDVDAGLIVMGSKGWGALKSAVLGSTSQRVLHRTDRDVLVVSAA
ncbi:MAG: universal stress protein [Acidimicrobiia bacterium]|nr:universal stress protein [Acidimicrobiia bacterium]